ncbi:hypothetical protein E6C27_scaffold2458G00030 [Cucumis melo var. makuwa]|uniref:Retrotransposon gag domain-containing protein n=1 Tax=Cucumis melo var. makuwa TaxID=1194695 RepID=A0A5A7SWE7_CUCMM|nr:hypothetical protein E6C27_scaffold2458G00030 [Cucumis melo var. makuwa]
MLYLVEVPDSIRYLEARLEEISEKADTIDVVTGRVEGLPIQELLARVDTLEANVGRTINYEYEDSLSGFVAHMEGRVNELDSSQKTLLKMINGMLEDFRATLDVVRNEIAYVNTILSLTMRAMANQVPVGGVVPVFKVKVPELKPLCGVRDAKALKNFIFNLEQYFKATNTVTEETKVTLATMYLCEDAKLWWRSRYMDIQEGRCTIDTWDVLKKELHSQFFPQNVEILAQQKLHDLKHTGNIRENVKQFAGLMLDIRDMLEKYKVFCFVEELKPWAMTKLYEQRVQGLTSAYAAAERLFDLTSDSQDVRSRQSSSPGRNRNSRSSSPKDIDGGKDSGRDRRPYQSNTESTWRRPNNRSPPKRPLSCFICGGPHLARECPNKVDFHAFQASLIADSDYKSNQAEEAEARRLRLRWEKDSGGMKVVNSIALPIVGLMKQTMIKLGGWKSPVDFVVVKMDDFDVVLRMEFLLEHQVIPMPSARCLVITGSFPTVVQAEIRQPNGFKMISVMQLDTNRVQEEPPSVEISLGALRKMETVPKDNLCVPEKCRGVMPNSEPKSLSMRRRTDHGIESPSEAKAHEKSHDATEKKDRDPQQCIDRRIQSKLIVHRKYPLPALTRLFDHPCGVKYFPKSDIRSRYCRVKITKVKRLETTCVTGHGAYEFPVVSFSLTDAKGGKCYSVQSQINVLGHVVECHQSGLLREEDTQWSGNLECQAAFNGLKQSHDRGAKSLGRRCATDSLIKRSSFKIRGNRHFVLSSLVDGPYVGDRPQVHRVEEKWEQMADIAQVCLEEVSRPMEERVDQKRCPLEFEWMTKLSIKSSSFAS